MDTNKKIIAFVGRAGSGKDYQSSLLVEQGYHKMAFADALRKIAFTALGIDYNWGMENYDWLKQNEIIPTSHFNFRDVLEKLGTEGIRKYDDNFWAKCLVKDLEDNKYSHVCISDLRFPNEYLALWYYATTANYEFKCIFCDYKSERYQEQNNHASAALSNYFANRGFQDLQEITYEDIQEYMKSIKAPLV